MREQKQPAVIKLAFPFGFILLLFLAFFSREEKTTTYQDVSFYSELFNTERWYRIYLPKDYALDKGKNYPVVYYFHGYGGRYKWDTYDLEDDAHYPENGRKEPPFVMEWQDYVNNNDLIVVTWDGYEPNLHPGKKEREGIPYGNAPPYDYERAHDKKDHHWGWDFSRHFRELVDDVDGRFRTLKGRDYRGITGLSMGGLTAYYVAGQNKDLVGSVSSFDPADNYPRYGPKGHQAVFPILEMYRPLEGLGVRLTMTDGDWLKYNNWMIERMFGAASLTHFETHMADYPNHWAADIDKQLDFHMREFKNPRPVPDRWNHVNPAFPSFKVLGYNVDVQREEPALTLLKDVSKSQMKILARKFLPDGPLVRNETVSVRTPGIYLPDETYQLVLYNLSRGSFDTRDIKAGPEGSISLGLEGGGFLLGINGPDSGTGPKLSMVFANHQEYFYFEEGVANTLNFDLVNVGSEEAQEVEITAFSSHPQLNISSDVVKVEKVAAANKVSLKEQFGFTFTGYSDSTAIGNIQFEIKVDGSITDTTSIMVFQTPVSPYKKEEDLIILDGRTVEGVPIYRQGHDVIQSQSVSGGQGNGNGKLEPGEKALVYIRLDQGMAPNDTNTFHRSYLINHPDLQYVDINELDYEEKLSQAGATSVATVLSVAAEAPENHPLDLWFKVESLYNDPDDPASEATIYAHQYDYVRAKIAVGGDRR